MYIFSMLSVRRKTECGLIIIIIVILWDGQVNHISCENSLSDSINQTATLLSLFFFSQFIY